MAIIRSSGTALYLLFALVVCGGGSPDQSADPAFSMASSGELTDSLVTVVRGRYTELLIPERPASGLGPLNRFHVVGPTSWGDPLPYSNSCAYYFSVHEGRFCKRSLAEAPLRVNPFETDVGRRANALLELGFGPAFSEYEKAIFPTELIESTDLECVSYFTNPWDMSIRDVTAETRLGASEDHQSGIVCRIGAVMVDIPPEVGLGWDYHIWDVFTFDDRTIVLMHRGAEDQTMFEVLELLEDDLQKVARVPLYN